MVRGAFIEQVDEIRVMLERGMRDSKHTGLTAGLVGSYATLPLEEEG